MARVRVKLKQTGQIGTVEDYELQSNPDKFELLSSPTPEKKGGLLSSILPILGGVAGGAIGALGGPLGVIAGGGIGAGIGEGARQNITGEKASLGKIGLEAGLGALPLGKLLGLGRKAAPIAGEAVEQGILGKTGSGLRKFVANPKVQPSVGGASAEDEIAKAVQRLPGLTSSQKYAALEPEMKKLTSLIDDELKRNPKSFKLAPTIKAIDDNITGLANFDETVPGFVSKRNQLVSRLQAKADKNGNISPKILRDFKQELNDNNQITKIFTKIERGNIPLTPQEEAILAAWEATDNALTSAVPTVKELTKQQSLLFKAAPGLATARNKGLQLPLLNKIPLSQAPMQAGLELSGRGLQAVDSFGQSPLGRVLGEGGRQSVSQPVKRAGASLFLAPSGEEAQNNTNNQENNNSFNNEAGVDIHNQSVSQPVNQQAQIKERLGLLKLQAILSGNSKAVTQLEAIEQVLAPEDKKDDLSVAAGTKKDLATSGYRGLDEAKRELERDPSILTKQLVPGQFFSRKFDSAMFRTVEALLRMRSGAAVPEQEVRRYMTKYAPTFGDDPETVRFKLAQLEQDLTESFNTATTSSGSELEQYLGVSLRGQ